MNRRTGILVADGTKARFISVEVAEDEQVDGGPRLVEQQDLVNPDSDVPARVMFSDRSGRAHTSGVSPAHGLDDHRDDHRAEFDRRFARRVREAAERFVAEHGIVRLLLVAEPQLLGKLRTEIDSKRWRDLELVELGENLTRHSLRQIHDSLAQRGLVRAPQPPAGSFYRPRGQAASFSR